MRGFYFLLFCAGVTLSQAKAFDVHTNHTGFYFYGMGGMMTMSHDRNVRTGLDFAHDIEGAYGLTLGYNITNWIAPELQIQYATVTDTTASGQGREHAASVRLNAKVNFFTDKAKEDKDFKWYPFAKIGGVAHALYVNAPADGDKVGAYGGGVALGAGIEANYKALYLGLELSNDLLFMGEYRDDVGGAADVLIIEGGFNYQFSLMGAVGVHF